MGRWIAVSVAGVSKSGRGPFRMLSAFVFATVPRASRLSLQQIDRSVEQRGWIESRLATIVKKLPGDAEGIVHLCQWLECEDF